MNAAELRKQAEAAAAEERKAKAALRRKGELGRFWTAHYDANGGRKHGEFVGLNCNGCDRWEDSGHGKNCPVAYLEKLQEAGKI